MRQKRPPIVLVFGCSISYLILLSLLLIICAYSRVFPSFSRSLVPSHFHLEDHPMLSVCDCSPVCLWCAVILAECSTFSTGLHCDKLIDRWRFSLMKCASFTGFEHVVRIECPLVDSFRFGFCCASLNYITFKKWILCSFRCLLIVLHFSILTSNDWPKSLSFISFVWNLLIVAFIQRMQSESQWLRSRASIFYSFSILCLYRKFGDDNQSQWCFSSILSISLYIRMQFVVGPSTSGCAQCDQIQWIFISTKWKFASHFHVIRNILWTYRYAHTHAFTCFRIPFPERRNYLCARDEHNKKNAQTHTIRK